MYLFGTMMILGGIVAATLASGSYALATRGARAALISARWATQAALVMIFLAAALLVYAFVVQRYDIAYVYTYSSRELPLRYRIAAMWAGQPGSFLVWTLWGLTVAQVLVRRARRAEPYVLSVFLLIPVALLIFTLILNPFTPLLDQTGAPETPVDGAGLNELLENPWMIIHPPVLFAGYTLLAVPFAFAIGGLWRRDYDGWARDALPWALAGWAVLGAALLLGGYWAYETLGWGGYWGWDPVENSSLVPWLTASALIHALLVQRAHGGLRRTALALAIGTYLLVFYATYLTRSGVLANFSVHTFALEAIQPAMTTALALLVVGSGAMLAWRWREIPRHALSDYFLSRDTFVALAILGLVVIAAAIEIGTSMPLISALPGVGYQLQDAFGAPFALDYGTRFNGGLRPFTDGRFALTADFYTTTVPPFGLFLIALLTIGPLLGWRDTNLRRLLRALRWPFVAAIVVTCGAILLGVRAALPLAYLSLGAFAAGANLVMIVRLLRSGWLRIGGYLAHVGVVVLIAGIIGSTSYASPEQRLVLPQGETISAYGYDFTFHGWRVTPDNKGVFDVTVARDGTVFQATSLIYFIPRRSATMTGPAIKREALHDLYMTPVSYQQPVDRNAPEFAFNETRDIGPYTITFLGFDAADLSNRTDVGVRLRVRYQDQELALTPRFPLKANTSDQVATTPPLALSGGHALTVDAVDPVGRMARIRVHGLNLPIEPGLAVITISLKPGIGLVWAGVIIGVAGGLIALVRRARENRTRLCGARLCAPQDAVGLSNPDHGVERRRHMKRGATPVTVPSDHDLETDVAASGAEQ